MTRIQVTDEQIRNAQAGDSDAMWTIVLAFDPLFGDMIRSVARDASATDAEDYLQEARAVLIQHVRDYTSDASAASLSTFVYRAARRAILEAAVMNRSALSVDPTQAIRVRRALAEHGGDAEKAWEEKFRDASDPRKRMSRELYIAMVDALSDVIALDAPHSASTDGDEVTLSDVIADSEADVSTALERRELARWILKQIPPRQSLALSAFYGVGMTRMEDAEACFTMGVKPAALRKLRSNGISSARRVVDAHEIAA